jgi:hypothetical protein
MDIEYLKKNQPKDLDDAMKILIFDIEKEDKEFLKSDDSKKIATQIHHGAGGSLRNIWYLWWNKSMAKSVLKNVPDYPQERPALVSYFNSIGIYHADDMSSIITTTLSRKLQKQDIDLDGQVKVYKKHWEDAGVDIKNDMGAEDE